MSETEEKQKGKVTIERLDATEVANVIITQRETNDGQSRMSIMVYGTPGLAHLSDLIGEAVVKALKECPGIDVVAEEPEASFES